MQGSPRQNSDVEAVDAPAVPGVYYLLTKTGRLSYVGKAANLRRRLREHARDTRWARIADVRWELFASEAAAIARQRYGCLTPWQKELSVTLSHNPRDLETLLQLYRLPAFADRSPSPYGAAG